MSSDGTALRHNALVYESKDEYLARAVPFLKAGIEAGTDDSWNRSDRYEDPDRLLRRITPAPAPLKGLRPIPFGRGVEELREHVAHELAADETSEAQSLDLLLAATEIANNAMQHGG